MKLFGNKILKTLEMGKYFNRKMQHWEYRWPLVIVLFMLIFVVATMSIGMKSRFVPVGDGKIRFSLEADTCYSWDDEWELYYECPANTPEEILAWADAVAQCRSECNQRNMATCMGKMEIGGCTRLEKLP